MASFFPLSIRLLPWLRTRFRHAETRRSGQQAALAADFRGLIEVLNLQQPILVGYDWGARAACTTAALWPTQIGGLVSIGGYNIEQLADDRRPASAEAEHKAWYQWYFHTERGKLGMEQNRREICRLLWELWCPNWILLTKGYRPAERSCHQKPGKSFVAFVIFCKNLLCLSSLLAPVRLWSGHEDDSLFR